MPNRFKVEPGSFGQFSQHTLQNTETGESAVVVDGCGATLQALNLRGGQGQLHGVIEGHPTPTSLSRSPVFRAGAPLVPFANRVRAGRYTFQGREHVLPVTAPGAHAIHGFLFDKTWRVTSARAGEAGASLGCEYLTGERDFPGYPFALLARLDFTLSPDGLQVTTTVVNTGGLDLPLTVGHHPYLVAGAPGDRKIDSCTLRLPAAKRLELRDMIPTGKVEPVHGTRYDFRRPRLIGQTGFDEGFTGLSFRDGVASVRLYREALGFGVELWQDRSYGFLQVYTPPERGSIAVEPMSGAADAFNNGMGLTVLKPSGRFTGTYGLRAV